MNKIQASRLALNRRDFLKLLGAATTTATLGHVLFTYAPWLDYDEQVMQTWSKPLSKDLRMPEQMRELVRYATLAPNGHNTQPWKFAIKENAIQIHPDYSRRLPVVDPYDRELWISLGCALENLVIASQAAGYESEVIYPFSDADYIEVKLREEKIINSNPLFDAIPERQCTRSLYNGLPLPIAELDLLQSIQLEPGIEMQLLTSTDQIEAALEYVKAGDQRQYSDQAFIDELVDWLRFNKAELFETLDGLYSRCSGNPEVPRWLGKMFVTTRNAGQQAQTDEMNVRSSSGLFVITTEQDNKHAWINTGRAYERLALTLTSLSIRSAVMNQPIEIPELRSEFQSYLNIGASQPQFLLRFGYADSMPRSLRRPVDQVLV